MSNALGIFRSAGDPSSVGLTAAIGQLARNITSGLDYVKTGTSDTAWALASTIFGGLFHGAALQAFTAPGAGTYTPTAGMKYCLVISTGAGGGGGGADTNGVAGIVGVGAGGGGGGTCIELFAAATIGASQALSVGTGGTAGANTGGNGGVGGDTTFGGGPLHTANGGSGGLGSGASAVRVASSSGANGGNPSGGTINIAGGPGGTGVAFSLDGTTDVSWALSGFGGGSFWGGGGKGSALVDSALASGIASSGFTAAVPGCGGSGAVCLSTTTGETGGAGANGICVVIEFLGPA